MPILYQLERYTQLWFVEDKNPHKQLTKFECIFLKITFFDVQTLKHCIAVVFWARKLGKISFCRYFISLCPWYPLYTNLSVTLNYELIENKKPYKQLQNFKCVFLKITFFDVETLKHCISAVFWDKKLGKGLIR